MFKLLSVAGVAALLSSTVALDVAHARRGGGCSAEGYDGCSEGGYSESCYRDGTSDCYAGYGPVCGDQVANWDYAACVAGDSYGSYDGVQSGGDADMDAWLPGEEPILEQMPEMPAQPPAPQLPTDPQVEMPSPKLRHWVDRSGKFSREGELLLASHERVRLITPSGMCYDIAMKDLSAADVQYVSGLIGSRGRVLDVPKFGAAMIAPQSRHWDITAGNVQGRLVYANRTTIGVLFKDGRRLDVSRASLSSEDLGYLAAGDAMSVARTASSSSRQ